jgi:hypothetical protein
MSDTRTKLAEMKDSLKKINDLYVRNKGIYESKMQELKEDFGFDSIDEANDALTKMQKKVVVLKKRLDDAVVNFETKYQDVLA